MRAALLIPVLLVTAARVVAGEGRDPGFTPQRVTARPEGVKQIYLAQLLDRDQRQEGLGRLFGMQRGSDRIVDHAEVDHHGRLHVAEGHRE